VWGVGMWTAGDCRVGGGNVVLLGGRGLELHDELGEYPAAVFDVDALAPGPVADLGGVQAAHAGLAAGACRAPRAGLSPGRGDIRGQRGAQRLGVPGAEVDFVAGAVQGEPDGAFGCARTRRPHPLQRLTCLMLAAKGARHGRAGQGGISRGTMPLPLLAVVTPPADVRSCE
jgi:hypothetical protein